MPIGTRALLQELDTHIRNQAFTAPDHALADQCRDRHLGSKARREPPERRRRLAATGGPFQLIRQPHHRTPSSRTGLPAKVRQTAFKPAIDLRPDVKSQPAVVPAGSRDRIFDHEPSSIAMEGHGALVPGTRRQPLISVMGRPPDRLRATIEAARRDLHCLRDPGPHEGTARHRLVVAGQLEAVVADRRAKIRPPLRFPLIGVGSGIDQDLHAAATELDGQGVRMRMGRNREEAVRSMIAAAPDLVLCMRRIAQQNHASVRETMAQPARAGTCRLGAVCQPPPEQRPQIGRSRSRLPPVAGAEQGGARGKQRGTRVGVRVVEQQAAAMIGVALAWRPTTHVERRREGIHHRADALPERAPQRMARSFAFDSCGEKQLEHEDMVAAGQLPVQAALEGLMMRFAAEHRGRILTPAPRLREIGKGAAGCELACCFSDDVIVRGGTVAAQAGEVFLVMIKLTLKVRVVVEQGPNARPAVQETPDPDPGDQSDAELDPAGPMHTGQERVVVPPGPKLPGHEFCVARIRGQEIGCSEDGQLVVPRGLPDVFDGADLTDVPAVDIERVGGAGRAQAGPRVEKPVGIARQAIAHPVEKQEPSCERRIGSPEQPRPRLFGKPDDVGGVDRARKSRDRNRQRKCIGLPVPYLTRAPSPHDPGVAQTPLDLRKRHPGKSPGIPCHIHWAARIG